MKDTSYMKAAANSRNTMRAKQLFHWGIMIVLAFGMMGPVGCKSKKKLAEAQRAEAEAAKAAQIAKIKAELQAMLDSPARNFAELEDKENRLEQIKSMNIDDSGVMTLIKKVEYALEKERERLEAEAKAKEDANKPQPPSAETKLAQAFSDIANAGNTAIANSKIEQALQMFSSDNIPVLIIINKSSNGTVDYDKPTTIKKYLNYLKDHKQNPNNVENLVFDSRGRIKELELIKK